MTPRTFLRTALVLLAAALVIAVTWARFSPHDAARELAAQIAAARAQTPAPGAEAVLRRAIAAPPRNTGNGRPRPDLAHLGPLQSIAYRGGFMNSPLPGLGTRVDQFRATYANGALEWQISVGPDGAARRISYFDPAPLTRQQLIDRNSTLPAGFWASDMVMQLVILLVIALIGRKALRIRL